MPPTIMMENFLYYIKRAEDESMSAYWRDYFCNCAASVLSTIEENNMDTEFGAERDKIAALKDAIMEVHNQEFIEKQAANK